jgi:hypothetical protein
MGKDFRKPKPDPDAFYVTPYSNIWEIFVTIDKIIDVDKVIKFLKANSLWAFVRTEQHQILRHYFLFRYIMLPYPQNHDWFEVNLGDDDEYRMTNEDPNKYRARAMDVVTYPKRNYTILIKIDREKYIPGTGPYMYNY